jgi:Copper type II ascorbate-dependent monooxygenase, C-terminal domain
MPHLNRFLFLLALGAGACGATDEAPPSLDPGPPSGGQQLAMSTYDLAPGAEVYMCFQFYSPDEPVAITKVQSISGPGIHHLVIYQASGENEPDAPHECNVVIKNSWLPIWASGTASKDMTLPDGTGFTIQPHTQYILQAHLLNASDATMSIRAGINLSYDRGDTVIPAGLYALGTFDLDIPANTTDFQRTIDCTPGKTMNVFTVFPHMHQIGTKLEVTRSNGAAPPADFYKIDPWTFGNQPMDPLSTTIQPTDTLHATCHYDNHSSDPVVYGESSNNEMCFFLLYYYPYTGIDGCIAP